MVSNPRVRSYFLIMHRTISYKLSVTTQERDKEMVRSATRGTKENHLALLTWYVRLEYIPLVIPSQEQHNMLEQVQRMVARMISSIDWFPHEEKTKCTRTIQYGEETALEDRLEVCEMRTGMGKVKLRSGC